MQQHFFQRLRLLMCFEIESCRQRLRQLAALDYPTEVASKLIGSVEAALVEHEQRILPICEGYGDDPEGAAQQLQSQHRKLLLLLPYLELIERSQTARVPWSLVPFFEETAQYLSPNAALLTSTTTDFNYRIRWAENHPFKTNILELPSLHRSNAFLHIIVGHELFHPVVGEFVRDNKPAVYANLREPCQAILKKEPEGTGLFSGERLDQLMALCVTIWERAVTELLCDLGCVAIFGPAALLATSMFATCYGLDDPPQRPEWYPPLRFRLRAIMEHGLGGQPATAAYQKLLQLLKRDIADKPLMDAAACLEEQMKLHTAAVQATSDQQRIAGSQVIRMAYEEVVRVLPSCSAYIATKVAVAKIRTWLDCLDEVPSLLRCFEMRVPASEVRQVGEWFGPASTPCASALAAWLCQLRSERAPCDLDDYLARCRLMFKSFEDSHMKRQFCSRSGKGA